MAEPEKSIEGPKDAAPNAPERVTAETGVILDALKNKMQEIDDDPKMTDKNAAKKAFIKERLAVLTEVEVEALKAQIDHTPELVDALVGIHEVIEEKRAVLKAQVEAGQKKPEGWMATMGQKLEDGVNTAKDWLSKAWGWTSSKSGEGWQGLVKGITAAVSALGTGWAWLREKSAQAFGSLVASVDEYLPDGIKKALNFVMGDFGVVYKNFAKFQIEVSPNKPEEALVLKPFMDKFQSITVTGQPVTFDEYCRLVALKLREGPPRRMEIPLKVTQAQLETAADKVVEKKIADATNTPVQSAAPAPAPGTAPAVAPGSAPVIAPKEIQSLAIADTTLTTEEHNEEKMVKVGERLFSVRPVVWGITVPLPVNVSKIEQLGDGSLAITGKVVVGVGIVSTTFEGRNIVTGDELKRVVGELKEATSVKTIEVSYINKSGEPKKGQLVFTPV